MDEVSVMTAVSDRQSIDRIIHDQADALQGFTVVAIDGAAGTVAKDQERVDDDHLVVHVDSGFLGLFGTDVVVESEAIDTIDAAAKQIHIDRIADWVKASPKVDQFAEDHR
jgi:hypothetical protein